MKKTTPNLATILSITIPILLSGLIEVDNFLSGLYQMKKSVLFSLPVNFTVQIIAVSTCVVLKIVFLKTLTKYLKKNRPTKPPTQQPKITEYKLKYL